jgi:hypothetical protein
MLARHHFGFFAMTSAELDNISWKKIEEILFRWLI